MNHRLLSKPAEKLCTRVANNLVQALVERAAKHGAPTGVTVRGGGP
jgi:galactokinase/mevalonate kinase-like predicted kinase